MIKNMTRFKVVMMCLVLLFAVLLAAIAIQNESIKELKQQAIVSISEPETITGEYTIIHYPSGGWANAIYITDYKLDGQVLWYREKDSTEDKPVWFDSVLLVDGWITGDKLVDYGYWLPSDFE